MRRVIASAAVGLAALALATGSRAAEAPSATVAGLKPHRAVYELTLASRTDKSEIGNVTGRLVYEFVGSACDGFTTQFRLVTRLENTDGRARISDMRTSSFEDAAGKTFDFLSQNFLEQQMTDESKGTAQRSDAGIVAKVTRPVDRTVNLPPDANFPTQHMTRLIDAAKEGRSVAQVKLYDGSEGGERLYDTTAIIGKVVEGADDVGDEKAADKPGLAAARRWPMTVSYFDPAKRERGEDTPEYQLSFLLYENGISRRLKLDYGDFALSGKMSELDLIDQPSSCH
ncbi:cell envelope integrity EipB family protein [Prosthecomicrobium sp. N25]|uniref:cell envelope integrity EipB family protein n=1 Tax=Prosthecomicrobium sp. N25 TaxID=3129254 RepID=UPI003076C958